ncbi:MAG: hypothetical protein II978_06360 [Clostridia bacterium]|nr:hypothetical protein [Clostridia bacterium]
MNLIDIHSHFLPGIDDGAEDSDVSIEMLSDSMSQGVEVIVATPHYYGKKRAVDDFIKLREESFLDLSQRALQKNTKLPKILLGAEVALTRGISVRENLDMLCIQDSNLLLLELPFEKWDAWVYNEVERVISNWQITVILAHPERYVRMPWDIKKLKPFFDMGVALQINAETVLEDKGWTKRFLKSGCPCVLGSDAHNMHKRKSQMGAAAKRLTELYGETLLEQINEVYDILGLTY